jgi:group II intron reverse transcriptase/maturase
MGDTQRSETISTKLERIAELARDNPDMVFTSLAHLMRDRDFLQIAFRQVNKKGSPGIDGITAKAYAENLDQNLRDLIERLRDYSYRATPVKRVWLDEGTKKRPIGKPVLEDKIVQRAMVMLLEAVYEQDFYDFSHGFRKGHSPHQALHQLREQCMEMNIGWIVDADVSGFFDNIDHGKLREIIKLRVNDGGMIRLIGKFLNAGVLEGETLSYPKKGTPQGGVISPMLANIFLHHVLDEWFVEQVQPRMKGRVFLIRFADDFVIGCELEQDAQRIMEVLPKRFDRFGLAIHSQKSKLVRFEKPGRDDSGKGNGTFDFLGFTHYWAKSRRGYWVIKRRTISKRRTRAVQAFWQWCKQNRHRPVSEQHKILCQKLRGYYQYYAIKGNYRALEWVRWQIERGWKYWLSHRNSKNPMSWEKFDKLKTAYPLPRPRIIHAI